MMSSHNNRMELINALLKEYCKDNVKLYHILYKHSRDVANKALAIIDNHPELNADRFFVEEAAMLHDIGMNILEYAHDTQVRGLRNKKL